MARMERVDGARLVPALLRQQLHSLGLAAVQHERDVADAALPVAGHLRTAQTELTEAGLA